MAEFFRRLSGKLASFLGMNGRTNTHLNRGIAFSRRRSLSASVILACPYCGAPGVYKVAGEGFDQWPGVLVPAGHPKHGKPIEGLCPNCSNYRPSIKALGEVWHEYL